MEIDYIDVQMMTVVCILIVLILIYRSERGVDAAVCLVQAGNWK